MLLNWILNFQFQWSWIKIKVDLINRILKSECCALKGHCNLILESCAVIFMLLPECHFHTGFLIGIKLIQISVLNIVIHAGAIQIIFLSIQLFKDFTKSFMDQQITFQENATYKRKTLHFRPKMGFCVTVCVQRKFIQICLVHLSLFGLCHSVDDMSKLKLCIQTIPRAHILS